MDEENLGKFEDHEKWLKSLGVDGEKLNLDEVDLRGADFSRDVFNQGYIVACFFNGILLESVDFYSSVLCSSSFKDTKLKKCDFYKSDLSYVNFEGATIENTRFSKSDCCEADFSHSQLIECNLVNASFHKTNFSNALFNDTNIEAAYFDETIFDGTQFENITGIEEAHFKSINIGTMEMPILLKGDEAKAWVNNNNKRAE